MKGIRDTVVVKTGSQCLHSGLCAVRKTDINQTITQTYTTINHDKCNEGEVSPHFVRSYFPYELWTDRARQS